MALLTSMGADVVAASFLIEIAPLDGRLRLGELPVHSVITYA